MEVGNFTCGEVSDVGLVDGETSSDVGTGDEDNVVAGDDDAAVSDGEDDSSNERYDGNDEVIPPQVYDLFDDSDDDEATGEVNNDEAPRPRELKAATDPDSR